MTSTTKNRMTSGHFATLSLVFLIEGVLQKLHFTQVFCSSSFFFVISIHSSVSFECKCKCVEVHFTVGIHETKKKTGKKKAPQRTQFIHACIQVVSDLSARVLFETKSMKRLEEFVSNYEWFAAQTRSFTMTTQLVATNYLPKMYRNARQ